MKIMLDTNVLFSGLIYGGKVAPVVVEYVNKHYDLYLPSYAIDELNEVVCEKKPHKADEINDILAKLSYTLLQTPKKNPKQYLDMRDPKDIPILRTAVIHKIDILITGDKDFDNIDKTIVQKPRIMNMSAFADEYMKGVRIYDTINPNPNMER
ncbi:MAG: putative toxin-antitoxin system toxin component, PIN family [Turicibacter sp.]|nr:putative toxin-antitoxin system toxin component, PIN family [Turicibacter sp.]